MQKKTLAAAVAATFLLASCAAPQIAAVAPAAVEKVTNLDTLIESAKKESEAVPA